MPTIRIRDYTPDDAPAFKALNLAWIEPLFEVEASDLAQLDDPQGAIIDKGGRVLIAEYDGQPVGTAALVNGHEPGTVELVKMSARADLRGIGIGKALISACIESARDMKADRIWLETNSQLDAALGLYRASGFRDLAPGECTQSPYRRCDVQMIFDLQSYQRTVARKSFKTSNL